MKISIYQPSDIDELKRITVEGFEGIAIDQSVENGKRPVTCGKIWAIAPTAMGSSALFDSVELLQSVE